jgi:hypothetical protein
VRRRACISVCSFLDYPAERPRAVVRPLMVFVAAGTCGEWHSKALDEDAHGKCVAASDCLLTRPGVCALPPAWAPDQAR